MYLGQVVASNIDLVFAWSVAFGTIFALHLSSVLFSIGNLKELCKEPTGGYPTIINPATRSIYLACRAISRGCILMSSINIIVGFSRGAHQIRVLAGMIKKVSMKPCIMSLIMYTQVGLMYAGNVEQIPLYVHFSPSRSNS
jgi:hypothetical protein